MKVRYIIILIIMSCLASAHFSGWTQKQSPSAETFNGISSANNFFSIGVGKNGSIVHFKNGDTGTIIPSGTNNELFDVYTSSEKLAVASGKDVVLLWDGSNWTKIRDTDTNTLYTGTWITPEEDVVFHQSLGFFNFICPHRPGVPADQQPFCRAFNSPMLTACGKSGDIKFFTSDGNIHHMNNNLSEISGTTETPLHLYHEFNSLNLTAVYAPKSSCLSLGIKPINVYGIRNSKEFWKFDGENWSNMNVNVPTDQTLSWLSGTSSSQIYAVGFKPDGNGGNTGVIWKYNGVEWMEETTLPDGVVGLTDVAASLGRIDNIFKSGFEIAASKTDRLDFRVDILAAAEAGKTIDLGNILPASIIDLSVQKDLLTPEPIKVNDTITFKLEVKNIGNTAAVDFRFLDGYINTIQHISNTCGMTFRSNNVKENSTFQSVIVPLLAAGDSLSCTMSFKVIGKVGDIITNVASIREEEYQFDAVFANNSRRVTNIKIQAD